MEKTVRAGLVGSGFVNVSFRGPAKVYAPASRSSVSSARMPIAARCLRRSGASGRSRLSATCSPRWTPFTSACRR